MHICIYFHPYIQDPRLTDPLMKITPALNAEKLTSSDKEKFKFIYKMRNNAAHPHPEKEKATLKEEMDRLFVIGTEEANKVANDIYNTYNTYTYTYIYHRLLFRLYYC